MPRAPTGHLLRDQKAGWVPRTGSMGAWVEEWGSDTAMRGAHHALTGEGRKGLGRGGAGKTHSAQQSPRCLSTSAPLLTSHLTIS